MKQLHDHTSLSTLLGCPRKFFHAYVERLESPFVSTPMHAGSAVHKGLQVLYSEGFDALPEAIEAMRLEFGDHYDAGFDYMTPGHLEIVLKNYVDHWDGKDPYTVLHTIEEPITGVVGGVEMGGIPDLIVDDDGDVLVLDHKTTTGYLGSRVYNRAKFGKQLPIYCVMAKQKFGADVKKAVVNAIYTGKYASSPSSKAQKFDRYVFSYTEEQLDEAERWVGEMRRLMENYEGGGEIEWPQHGGDHCGWCAFSSLCEVTPTLRQLRKKNDYIVREPTGILLSGADE